MAFRHDPQACGKGNRPAVWRPEPKEWPVWQGLMKSGRSGQQFWINEQEVVEHARSSPEHLDKHGVTPQASRALISKALQEVVKQSPISLKPATWKLWRPTAKQPAGHGPRQTGCSTIPGQRECQSAKETEGNRPTQ